MLASLFERLRSRRELERLSAHMLRDIGVDPDETRLTNGPSILILQPELLRRLRDPAPMPSQPAARGSAGRTLWINMLRRPAARPI